MNLTHRALLLTFVLLAPACGRDTPPEPSPGSGPAKAGAEPAQKIRYIERVTGGADANERLPLIVAIHGLGDRPESFVRLFDGFQARMRVVIPYGTTPQGQGFSWFPLARFEPTKLAEGTGRAADGLAALLEELERTRPTRGRPIVTGFSQGGMLSFTLAARHPERVGEALPIAGLLAPPLYPTSWPMGKVAPKVLAFHGDADTIVPLEGAEQTVRALVAVGFSAELRTYPGVGHTVTGAMRQDWQKALEAAAQRAAASSP
ncbi:alpha/beta hydrolase [Polyangium spumosum]|uniref:Alpha/beta fold hydrolase n=1 Tax=Polyangium spumosum TaxID=889282 RepID=A0A6N7PVM2_9BACT|nr:alpha/beta fold hydrolase [Polyangium spumosum]MRG95577.1 alpha/beta fold hydrolase [Polyangium spumosum]